MYLKYYMNDDGDRVYTMKVSKEDKTRLRLAGDGCCCCFFFHSIHAMNHGIIHSTHWYGSLCITP